MNRYLKKAVSLLLSFIMVFSTLPAFASEGKTPIYVSKQTYELPLWHYSGNYWMIGSGPSAVKVPDKTLDKEDGLLAYLNRYYNSVTFSIPIPDSVKKAWESGYEVSAALESRGNALWTELFDPASLTVISDIKDGESTYSFSLAPRYNLVNGIGFTDFVPGLTKSIPLIHYRFGSNIYAVYKGSRLIGQGNGFFSIGAKNTATVPYIHPSMITDSSGAFSGGNIINAEGNNFASDGYSAGSGTFANAGAVGILFSFPINVVFYKTAIPSPSDQGGSGETPDNVIPGKDPGSRDDLVQDPGDSGKDDPLTVFDSIHPVLELPSSAYVNHPVIAEDCSDLSINGSFYSAARAYGKDLAVNSFDFPGAYCKASDLMTRTLIYPEKGTYCVTLKLLTKDGEEAETSKAIRILPCPSVAAVLSGTQKENRKQVLDISAAQDPSNPIKELSIELKDKKSGESITVKKNFSGKESAPSNSRHIKYRSLKDAGSDSCYVRVSLEFLSKFDSDRIWIYTVTAKDGAGKSASVQNEFRIERDKGPEPVINLEEVYYREEGSNTAVIEVCDTGKCNPAAQRIWYFDVGGGEFVPAENTAGFEDRSLGTGRTVCFSKEGVGPFRVALSVKDVWTEETLEEYVTDADRKTASVCAESHVGNMEPGVSFSLKGEKNAELLLVADSQEEACGLKKALPSLEAELKARGINADISVELLENRSRTDELIENVKTVSAPWAHLLIGSGSILDYNTVYSSFWSLGHARADENGWVTMESTRLKKDDSGRLLRDYPYIITSYDSRGEKRWSFTITENIFSSPTGFNDAFFGTDLSGNCVYLVSDGKTLLLDAVNGGCITVLPFAFGATCAGDSILCTVKDDGLWTVDISTGKTENVHPGMLWADREAVRILGGRLCFTETKDGALLLCTYGLKQKCADRSAEVKVLVPAGILSTSRTMAIDSRGYIFVGHERNLLSVYDLNGTLKVNSVSCSGIPVLSRNGSGEINSLFSSERARYMIRGEISYRNSFLMRQLFGSRIKSHSVSDDGDYIYKSDIRLGLELADGTYVSALPLVLNYGTENYTSPSHENNYFSDGSLTDTRLLPGSYPATDFGPVCDGGAFVSVFSSAYSNTVSLNRLPESREDALERLKTRRFSGKADLDLCIEWDGSLSREELLNIVVSDLGIDKPVEKTYSKGQTIAYQVTYTDYENDPSKKSYWCYDHEPLTDGLWGKSGTVLDKPVTVFDKDGKYTVTHWQTDNAGRGLTEAYDKDSDKCTMVLYISSGGKKDDDKKENGTEGPSNHAPSVKLIETNPAAPCVDDTYTVNVKVDDEDKDKLNVTVDIYNACDPQPLKTVKRTALTPSAKTYPEISVTDLPAAKPGKYTIVVTVSDGEDSGSGEYSFTPKVKNSACANVIHTEEWEGRRLDFNIKYFGKDGASEVSDLQKYKKTASPRLRGRNVFWPGEKLIVNAEITGNVKKVTASLSVPAVSTTLSALGPADEKGCQKFSGSLWSSGMADILAKNDPRQENVTITVTFTDGTKKNVICPVIFDQDIGYWMLHRVY